MNFNLLEIKIEDAVCTITLNNPETLNALNSKMLDELDKALDILSLNNEVRVLIITGAGRSFVAGADISQMRGMSEEEALEFGRKGSFLFRKIETFPIPVIAAVNGFALGGGCELAMSCDIRVASEKAKFGQPEVSLGITPGFSGCVRLTKIAGAGIAKEMIFTGRIIDAAEALKIGIVNFVTSPEDLMNEVTGIALKIASNAPFAVRNAKNAINFAADNDTQSASDYENIKFASCFNTDDQKEGMGAFLERRKPNFKNM